MRALKIVLAVSAGLVALVALLFVVARFSDGPLAVIPGGPLVSGEIVAAPVGDWGFAEAIAEIELQLEGDDTSRTVWILVRDGQAFVPCSLGFPPGKTWHTRADAGGRATIRLLGKRHPVTLTRVKDAGVESDLKTIVGAKYGGGPPSDAGVWFFAVTSRTS